MCGLHSVTKIKYMTDSVLKLFGRCVQLRQTCEVCCCEMDSHSQPSSTGQSSEKTYGEHDFLKATSIFVGTFIEYG